MMRWNRLPKPARQFDWSGGLFLWLPVFLLLVALGLALSGVWLQHQVRHLETRYSQDLKMHQQLKAEWGKLMLEQSHLTARARVRQIAEQKLHLRLEKNPQLHNFQSIDLLPKQHKALQSQKSGTLP